MSTVKIAILGGGMSALAAAVELTEPRHGGKFEVQVYQLGWRLGGKCASGRDQNLGNRIKEHGPHIIFGWYDNTFSVMREVYDALASFKPRRFTRFEDALLATQNLGVMEQVGGSWLPWTFSLEPMRGLRTGQVPANLDIVRRVLDWMGAQIRGPSFTMQDVSVLLQAQEALEQAAALPQLHESRAYQSSIEHLAKLQQAIQSRLSDVFVRSNNMRHIEIMLDLAAAVLLGATKDHVLLWPTRKSIERINELDFRRWILNHGARPTTANSALVRGIYDTVFAYEGGDISRPGNLEAGSTFLAMKASIGSVEGPHWKMRAGTGDILAAPIYELLRSRGVEFNFFHRVDKIISSPDGNFIDAICVGRQVTLKSPRYDPLIDCSGLPSWPDRPLYGQIVDDQARQLVAQGIDLESFWTPWRDPLPPVQLTRANRDFDAVILGISVGMLPFILPDTPPSNWGNLFKHLMTLQTQNVQLWLDKTIADSGWTVADNPVITAFDSTPIDTWLDATGLRKEETSPYGAAAQIAMLCGPMITSPDVEPPSSTDFPEEANKLVADAGRAFLAQAQPLWPMLYNVGGFDWNRLLAAPCHTGIGRFDDQFWKANINPSDRYVQSLAGSGKFRLAANQSGYANLFLCGDWTDYGLNMGFLEGAVISGLRAANAISGSPRKILRDPYDFEMTPVAESRHDSATYVEHPGDPTAPAPFDFVGATMWIFALAADAEKLRLLCHQLISDPSQGIVTFDPLGGFVVMSFCDFPDCSIPGLVGGSASERELNFAIPGRYGVHPHGKSGLAVLMPYLFLDNPIALITGREEYGYFKQSGWITLPQDAGSTGFSVDVYGLSNPQGRWGRKRLIDLTRSSVELELGELSSPDLSVNSLAHAINRLTAQEGQHKEHCSNPVIEILNELLSGKMPQIFLKQFRGIADGTRACYQAVTLAEMTITHLDSISLVRSHDMAINMLTSAPLASTLGLNSVRRTGIGLKLRAQMRLEPGRVLWQA